MKRGQWLVAGALGLVVAGLLVAPTVAAKAELGKTAPSFTLPDLYGNNISLDAFKGKTIVLEWFNPGCPFVQAAHEKKVTQKLIAEYASKGVIWLAIDSGYNCDAETNRVYAAEHGLAYPILLDPDGKVGKLYGAKSTPHMFVIDKSGLVAYNGAIDDQKNTNYVKDALDAVLAGKPVKKNKTRPYGCGVKYKR